MNRRWLQFAISLALVAALIWFVDWDEVLPVLRSVDPGWTLLIVAIVIVERLLLNVKWHGLLAVGGVTIGFWRLFRIQLAANALGAFLPGSIGVDAFRIAGLWKYRDRRDQVMAATLIDRVTTALATVVVGGAMVVLVAGSLIGDRAVTQVAWGGAVLLAGAIAFLSAPGRRFLAALVRRLPEKFHRRLLDIGSATWLIAGHPRSIVLTVVTSLGAVALRVVIGKCLLLACGADVHFLTLGFILPVVWATTMLPISVGGIGVQDATYVVLLGYIGVGSAVAIVVSLLDHVLSRVPLLAGALFWRDVMPGGKPPAQPPAA